MVLLSFAVPNIPPSSQETRFGNYWRKLWQDARSAFDHSDLLWLGVVATVCLVASRYVPSWVAVFAGSLLRMCAGVQAGGGHAWTQTGLHLVRGIIYLLLPLLSLLLLRTRPRDTGWTLGYWRLWLLDTAILYVAVLPFLYWAAHQPSFHRTYPYLLVSRSGWQGFLLGQAVRLVYMLGWESLFRGYLLFGYSRRAGNAVGITISTIPFVLMHFGKPVPEVWGSIVAGVALGVLALRGRSFLPAAMLHYSVALTLDLLVLLT